MSKWSLIIILRKAYLHVENAYLSLPLLSAKLCNIINLNSI